MSRTLSAVEWAIRDLVNREVNAELSAGNLDRPNAEKYGSHPDGGGPRYAPEWYVAKSIRTGINESLHGILEPLLRDVAPRRRPVRATLSRWVRAVTSRLSGSNAEQS